MINRSFFEEPREQSRIKSRIVAKYFWTWANVVLSAAKGRVSRIAYVDLFAGPGQYSDGTPSTPIIVLKAAIKDPRLQRALFTLFNDKDAANARSLRAAISGLPGVKKLKYEPQVENQEVGPKIVKTFEAIKLVPTLLFVDPWGYKGLSLALINSVLQNWGCECIFFFNYNRINAALSNDAVQEHMNDLFGDERAQAIRRKLVGLGPDEREVLIIEELSKALKEIRGSYVLPFTFKNEQGTRTKHYLIFVSKNFKGYEIMKGIMAHESSERDQGVASFAYSEASQKYPTLFELTRPLDDLEDMLLKEFGGHKLAMSEVYGLHNIGRPYIKSNYKKILAKMEASGKIEADPSAEKRRKGTFPDNVVVTFPQGAKK
jgi:three-Cys-motif partner protein